MVSSPVDWFAANRRLSGSVAECLGMQRPLRSKHMRATKYNTLRVPGASLFYTVCGAGPVLLMIAAGAGDHTSYTGVAKYLIDHYTVVTYDRRGYWRSPLDDRNQHITIVTHSDDAHHLLAALGREGAYVFGSSIGALIGLDLVIHYPEQVRTLIAHEPPVAQMVSEAKHTPRLLDLYRQQGAAAALETFAASIGVRHRTKSCRLGLPQESIRIAEYNRESFFKHDAGAVGRYRLDMAALQAAPTRVVLAGGREGHEYFPYRCTAALAERLGTAVVAFPGGHAGFVDHPGEFAERLRQILGDEAAK